MKNKIKYLPALLMCPFLFMGAGYGEHQGYAYPHYYEDYELTAINFEDADENGKYPFSITIENTGDTTQPVEILYHMNMGYPLLDEDSIVEIPSDNVTARDAHAEEDIANWMHMIRPEAGYVERCYYHTFEKEGKASIYQPKIGKGLTISFDPKQLDCFVEWKMMGVRDYVLGLECGNCYPDGRDVMRKTGRLKFLEAGEKVTYEVKVALFVK